MKESIVLMPRDLSRELRQYKDISLIYYVYISNNYMEYQTKYEYSRLNALYNSLYKYQNITPDYVRREVKFLGINYVAIPADKEKAIADSLPEDFELICNGSDFKLYKTNIE